MVVDDAPMPEEGDVDFGRLRAALLTLPEKYQSVISLHYLEGIPVLEVSQLLSRPEGTIKTWLKRARDLLRKRLEKKAS